MVRACDFGQKTSLGQNGHVARPGQKQCRAASQTKGRGPGGGLNPSGIVGGRGPPCWVRVSGGVFLWKPHRTT
jgi:hypothetical protein